MDGGGGMLDGYYSYGLKRVTKLVDFEYNGVRIGLEPWQAQVLETLIKNGSLPKTSDYTRKIICDLRQALADVGVPLEILTIHGRGYEIRPIRLECESGSKEADNGRAYASSGSADSVQGGSWRARP